MNLFHGVDLIEVERIASMLKTHGEKFENRCFTESEQSRSNVSSEATRSQRYAVRYAAKEAVLKALGTGLAGGIEWTDISIEREDGPPNVLLTGEAARIAKSHGITSWLVSLSHTDTMAIASVIGIGES